MGRAADSELEARLTDPTRDWETEDGNGTVRVAVVGLGGYSINRALPALSSNDYCKPTVAVSGSPETAADARDRFDLGRVLTYEAYHDGEATADYDAVYVATPPALHPEAVMTAAKQGKHVLCEKPMAATVDGAELMCDACYEAGVILMVAYRMQYDPVFRRLRDLIRGGIIGDVVQYHGNISIRLRTAWGGSLDTWRTDKELAGGGALPDLGIYPMNAARFLHGDDPVSVIGSTTTTDLAFGDVDQHVAYTLRFGDGVTASFTASHDAHPESHLQALGTEGRVHVDRAFIPKGQRQIVAEAGKERVSFDGPDIDEIEETIAAFGDAVLTGRTPEANGEQGLADVRTIASIYESVKRSEWVSTGV